MTGWAEHAIWWQLHPISFTGAEPEAVAIAAGTGSAVDGGAVSHRLAGLEAWLDYLIDLGCNGLALGPVFASETHGYDTVDHYRIDPRLGTDADFGHLVAACRDRGVRLLLDGVFNHVGRGFPAFQDVLAHGRSSRYAPWFRLDFEAGGPDGFGYADFEGSHNLVALNHAEPAVEDYVAGVLRHWLERGASGWRLDAAYAVPAEFWRAVLGRVRAGHPDAWFVGEVIHGDYLAIVAESGLDSVTQYELWKAIWSSLNDGNFFELAWALDRHNGFAGAFLPLTFAGNHDVTRIASQIADERHLAHALAILFTVAGAPSVYAGDEQAFRGVKYERAGGDEEIRPAFPAFPGELAPGGWPVYRLHQDLIGLRRRHPWLARARTRVLHLENEALAYESAGPSDGDRLAVLLNLSDHPVTFPASEVAGKALLASRDRDGSDGGGGAGGRDGDGARVEAHGWAVLEPGS
jgi:cyclomaltodextrinase / maltogenic alpha-amylase / neopullulanase